MNKPRIIMVPGGTSIGAVALAHAGIHKIVELHSERADNPNHPAPHTVLVIRNPRDVPPGTLRTSAHDMPQIFPPADFPELSDFIDDPALVENIDLIMSTSGSSGRPRWVGISIQALLHSAQATHEALSGPGRWILALPTHHIAGAMVLLRAVAAGFPPQIVDTSAGFSPEKLLPALRGATQDPNVPGYISLVPAQLHACLASDEVASGLAQLSGVLVGGAHCPQDLHEAAHARGIRLILTYGMTETCGGCIYDGKPLPGTEVRIEPLGSSITTDATDHEAEPSYNEKQSENEDQQNKHEGRIILSGPTMFTRYLNEGPLADHRHEPLITQDIGSIDAKNCVNILGRIDDIVISGGMNVPLQAVTHVLSSHPLVQDCHVLGFPHAKWGHEVVAHVAVGDYWPDICAERDGPALREYVAQRMERHCAPRRIIFTRDLPRLAVGKVDRAAVRDIVAAVVASSTDTEAELLPPTNSGVMQVRTADTAKANSLGALPARHLNVLHTTSLLGQVKEWHR
ncbi:AMP-binding protein [Schaalia sp. lx-260]|uniref:AMP-binding protein n=1 Tax=Schaalia sp. lx-260 TaxID=2899082 RepID=UPI001E2E3C8A|nr:AMP-binding protein [Schaalia sp. lx-260]MCD4548909.1 AMP-binding protein [Schaalia sp. lx-260]